MRKVLKSKIVRFLTVGGCSTAIDFVLYMLISTRFSIVIAKGISMIISSIFSYFANKNFTFKNRKRTDIGYLTRYYIIFAGNFATNLGVNYLMYYYTKYKFFAYACATACGLTVNYLGQRFFVFEKHKNMDINHKKSSTDNCPANRNVL